MMIMRLAALVVTGVLALAARPADARGYWQMYDNENKVDVGYLINAASIMKGAKRIGVYYLDIEHKDGVRVVTNKSVIFDIKADKLRKYGRAVATIDWTASTITFGKRKY